MLNYDNAEKNKIRSWCIDSMLPAKNILEIPGPECISTLEMKQKGKITSKSKVYTIERKKDSFEKIIQKLKLNKINLIPHLGELETFNHQDVEFGIVNLDTCSTLNEKILNFISKLNIANNGSLYVWVVGFRNEGELKHKLLSYAASRTDNSDYVMKKCNFSQSSLTTNASIIALTAALNHYDFKINYETYVSNVSMMYVYRFTNIVKINKPRTKLNLNLDTYQYQKVDYSNKTELVKITSPISKQIIQSFKLNQINKIKRILKSELNNSTRDKKWIIAGWKSNVSRLKPKNKKEIIKFLDSII
jgi:hypothetical protein